MGVDVSKIAEGDWVTVRMPFVDCVDGYVRVKAARGATSYVARESVVGHEPAPRDVRPGDRVTVKDGRAVYKVLAVHEGRAWLDDAAVPLRNPCRALEELRIVK